MDLLILRRTAAEIAAAAVVEVYPNVELQGGGETSIGFSYEFYIPHPVHLHLIEEKMRQIVREKRPIRTLEMVGFSATELFKSQGQEARAEEVEEGLVDVIQIGSFHDLSPGPHLKNTGELAAFKIEIELLADQRIRLVGWCHYSKEELKQYLKKINDYVEPLVLGERLVFWKGSVWLPEGLKMRQKLIHFLKKEWFADAFEISGESDDRLALHRSMGRAKVVEISIFSPWETQIQVSFFDIFEEEMISCLQSIGKTLTILGFDHSSVPVGSDGGYVVKDGLGRSHSVVQVKRISRKGSRVVDFYFTVMVETVLTLLLERNLVMVELENQ